MMIGDNMNTASFSVQCTYIGIYQAQDGESPGVRFKIWMSTDSQVSDLSVVELYAFIRNERIDFLSLQGGGRQSSSTFSSVTDR